ncbi:MAG: RHS repeat-associated core domain-containing protein, partial [Bacteroidetes bacterium]|nr:RHS repeat-associated core domain-containing protein [Bacteroidota bacterium]
AEAAIVDDILSTLRCLTGDEELAFDLGDFLYLPSIGEGITFTDDEGADLAAEELPAWLACSQSLYWAQQGGVNCSGLELLYFYHSDYLGSVEFVTDMRGEAYQFFLNTPWGENLENQFARNYTAFSSRFRFNGKEWDEETGNFYYGARYYDPKVSIWLSADPLAGEAPHLTPYRFSFNNPLNVVDPDGLFEDEWDFDISSGALTWVSSKGGQETQYVNIVDSEGFIIGEGSVSGNKVFAYRLIDGVFITNMDQEFDDVNYNRNSEYNYNTYEFKLRREYLSNDTPIRRAIIAKERDGKAFAISYGGEEAYYGYQVMRLRMMMDAIELSASWEQPGARNIRRFKSLGTMVKPAGTSVSGLTGSRGARASTGLNSWTMFLKANKGKYSGTNWMSKARNDYYKSNYYRP